MLFRATTLALCGTLALGMTTEAPLILYPITPSLPPGLYVRTFEPPKVGIIAAFRVPETAKHDKASIGEDVHDDFLFVKSDYVYFDSALPGFGLRIRANGKKTWYIHKRTKDGVLKRTVGDVSLFGLDDARAEARKILGRAQRLDLLDEHERKEAEEKRWQLEEEHERQAVTLGSVIFLYIAQYAELRQRARTQLETKRHLRAHWEPLHEIPLHKIRRREVATHLTEIAQNNGPIAADRACTALNHLFIWSMQQGLAEEDPVLDTSKPGKEVPRTRVLQPRELQAIRRATEHASDNTRSSGC